MVSLNSTQPVGPSKKGSGKTEDRAIEAFLVDIAAVARAVAPALVEIIGGARAPASGGAWTGDRRRGIELCMNMLRYARDDVPTDASRLKLDRGLAYLACELASLAGEPAQLQPN